MPGALELEDTSRRIITGRIIKHDFLAGKLIGADNAGVGKTHENQGIMLENRCQCFDRSAIGVMSKNTHATNAILEAWLTGQPTPGSATPSTQPHREESS